MIAPIQDGHAADPRPLREQAAAAFEAGGVLAGIATGDFAYEARPQQVAMAHAVADALEAGRHLVVEAGTGVGKSLAYLVPLILHAKRTNQRAMVSTHTISLQEQLVGIAKAAQTANKVGEVTSKVFDDVKGFFSAVGNFFTGVFGTKQE